MPFKDPEKQRACARASYRRHKDKILAKHREWRAAHSDYDRHRWTEPARRKQLTQAHRRWYSRQQGAQHVHSEQEWDARLAEFAGMCAYCVVRPATEREHMTPLSRGGDDHIENVVPVCRGCNARKNSRTLLEFVAA